MEPILHVIGGGLAGCEAAWQAASRQIPVILHEMRPLRATPAHEGAGLAELVCSNSLRNDDLGSGIGLLHEEMRRCDSLILSVADAVKVPAGGALAVDRQAFSTEVEKRLLALPNLTLLREEVTQLPDVPAIISSGPLTSDALAVELAKATGSDHLHFFDAIAPIVTQDSIDFSKAWFQSRWDKGTGKDYINCPLSKDEYFAFVEALIAADTVEFHDWEKDTPYFEGCLPIEVMARRGAQTLAFGPMKPVGLTNPHGPNPKSYAVIQLRQDNALGTLYNMVGFQTKLKHGEQMKLFRTIPGLENAEFARLGGLHRNTFLRSPVVLDGSLRLKARPNIRMAGQITGCEGYVESAAIGLLSGRFWAEEMAGQSPSLPPLETALGALLNHITSGAGADSFQPMNINFGLFPPLSALPTNIDCRATHDGPPPEGKRRKLGAKERRAAYAERALGKLGEWLRNNISEA
ncbi:MAG: methylenetetrahydrofolate--tRNA-(uracil(54)-C(5))-methyltransferase (FADH(2)-oxidizing) TrmFO [Rhodospirillales bacterium]|nr:methylenetetrahydrofolate--tRNA-(uracil(54)-C(5))-methyltransferase (FADH(2)-oxidizing) TrmFO [Rhodospirillales bacterium]